MRSATQKLSYCHGGAFAQAETPRKTLLQAHLCSKSKDYQDTWELTHLSNDLRLLPIMLLISSCFVSVQTARRPTRRGPSTPLGRWCRPRAVLPARSRRCPPPAQPPAPATSCRPSAPLRRHCRCVHQPAACLTCPFSSKNWPDFQFTLPTSENCHMYER